MSDEDGQVSEAETKAMEGGWRPIEDWKGDPDLFVTAEVFNERGEQILPIVKKHNTELREQVNALTGELETVKQTAAEFRKFQQERVESQKKFYDQQIADLKDLKKQAINDSDGEQVMLIDDQIEQAKEAQAGAAASQKHQAVDPATIQKMVADWTKENDWYSSQQTMADYANMYSGSIANLEDPEFSGRKLLDKVSKKVKESFPDFFKNPKRERESLGDGTGSGDDEGGAGKTFGDLPADAKKAFAGFKDLMPDYKKEDYAREYFAMGDD
jgi:hypothetical protein